METLTYSDTSTASGEVMAATGTMAETFRFRFSTKYQDEATGLYYYGYRFYSPPQGRFINRDPIEENGGLNLYGFVGNDPVNRIDIVGLCPCTDAQIVEKGSVSARTAAIYSQTIENKPGSNDGQRFEYCGILCCGKTSGGIYEVYNMPVNIRQGKGYNDVYGRHSCSIDSFTCKAGDERVGWFHSHPNPATFSNSDLGNPGYGFLVRDAVTNDAKAPTILMYEHSWKDKKTGKYCADIYSVDLYTKNKKLIGRQCGGLK